MKHLILLITGMFWVVSASCQKTEFEIYPNGLIYSEQTMNKLRHVADSLNLKFKSCGFNKVFYSFSQCIGQLVSLEGVNIHHAKKDMENQIPLEDFLKKYPNAIIDRDVLILKLPYKNYENNDIVEIRHFDFNSDYAFNIKLTDTALFQKDLTNQWLYKHYDLSTYSKESLKSFYFTASFVSTPIPQKYSQMIGYSDCLIDTTTSKFNHNLEDGWVEIPKNWITLSENKKMELLEELRSTSVVGRCSQDNRPREHAMNIALLSAETYKWEVFLKSHLDIMNDYFSRMSDLSSAQGQRNTYINELEELNINVSDLILGIIFRIRNPAYNHYFGRINRIGRALAETKNSHQIEQSLLSVISDTEVDYYNRLLFYYLFENYNHHLKDETVKKENNYKLAAAVKTLPDFFSKRILEK